MSEGFNKAPSRVLFVCVGNTCRSVFAEYLGPAVFGQGVVFESAGIQPGLAADAENAVYSLKANFDVDASRHVPRDVRSLDLTGYDLVIALDQSAVKVLRDAALPEARLRFWKVKDPWGGDLTEYDRAAIDIKRRLFQLKAAGLGSDEG
jgi:protein-tyrosine-phosphatase